MVILTLLYTQQTQTIKIGDGRPHWRGGWKAQQLTQDLVSQLRNVDFILGTRGGHHREDDIIGFVF